MSTWAIFSMLGIYPVNPAEPIYALTKPSFDKVTIHLDREYYHGKKLEIVSRNSGGEEIIDKILINEKVHKSYFISHEEWTKADTLTFILK